MAPRIQGHDQGACRRTLVQTRVGQSLLMPPRSTRIPAYVAAVLAFGSAAVSLYWTLGGTVLLDTVGGTFEDLARERSPQSIVLGMLVVLIKVAGGMLALALIQPWGTHVGHRLLLVSATVGSVVLVV
jgi:Protein of unknown function (DUF3995)